MLVDWLISNGFAASRLEAVTLASMLMDENFIKPMGARSVDAMRSGDLAEQFLDDSTALYTFVSDNISVNQISFLHKTVNNKAVQGLGSLHQLSNTSIAKLVGPCAASFSGWAVMEAFSR